MMILFIGFTLFIVNLPVYSIDSYGITQSNQMGIPETTSYQIQVRGLMDINLGVLENHSQPQVFLLLTSR